MIYLRRTFPITVVLLLTMAITACGGSTSSGYGSTPAATATTASSSKAVIKTTTATVNGKAETILTNTQGKTLYYFKSDTATTSACTGACAKSWPPEVTSGSPTSATALPGKLSAQTTANGDQVEYNGHFLYTFAADGGPGHTRGEGRLGKWFVATPNLK